MEKILAIESRSGHWWMKSHEKNKNCGTGEKETS